jgi:hypothetical protein
LGRAGEGIEVEAMLAERGWKEAEIKPVEALLRLEGR